MLIERESVEKAIHSLVIRQDHYLEIVWGIEEFNAAFGVKPNPELYANLIREETNEWQEELLKNGMSPNLLKETIDIIYVLEGFLAACPDPNADIDLPEDTAWGLLAACDFICDVVALFSTEYYTPNTIMEGFEEVQRSNMSKLDENGLPIRREDNKVLKGPNYSPADMTEITPTPEDILSKQYF